MGWWWWWGWSRPIVNESQKRNTIVELPAVAASTCVAVHLHFPSPTPLFSRHKSYAMSAVPAPERKVVVHPLVLLSVVDHYNRVAKDTKFRVVGKM